LGDFRSFLFPNLNHFSFNFILLCQLATEKNHSFDQHTKKAVMGRGTPGGS
jgi:hypothetical protein